MPDCSFRPFDVLIEHPMHYYTEASNFDQISINDSCLIGKFTHEDIGYLMKQMETVLRDVVNYFELTKNDAVCQPILARMRDADEDPDNFEEFKYVTDTFGNKALSVFEINFVTSFPVVIGVSMKGLFLKKREILLILIECIIGFQMELILVELVCINVLAQCSGYMVNLQSYINRIVL